MLFRVLCIIFLSLSCAGTLGLAYYAARSLRSAGANAFICFMMSVFIYTFGYIFELSADTVDAMFLALRIEYLGAPVIPVLWLIFALEYNEYRLSKKWLYPPLFVVPVITMVLLYSAGHTPLHYESLVVNENGPFPLAWAEKGPWYYINFAYMMVLNTAATALFGIEAARSTGYRKKQAVTIFAGSLFPWAAAVLTMLGVGPWGMDITPFFLSIAVPMFGNAMFRLRMFDIVPIARDKVFKTINTSVIVLDRENRVVDFNDQARSLLPGLDEAALGAASQRAMAACPELAEAIGHLQEGDREIEFPVLGQERCFTVSGTELRSRSGEDVGLIVSLHDITENKALLKRMERMATVDALTQAYSRRFFMESCLLEIRRACRDRAALSFLLVDIDHFKAVNDTHGHPAGDMVLRNTAAAIKRGLRTSDLLGRYGGEEFAMVLPDTDLEGALMLAERLRAEVASTITAYEGTEIVATISVGAAAVDFASHPAPDAPEHIREALLKASDQALYQAKEDGRNRVRTAQLS